MSTSNRNPDGPADKGIPARLRAAAKENKNGADSKAKISDEERFDLALRRTEWNNSVELKNFFGICKRIFSCTIVMLTLAAALAFWVKGQPIDPTSLDTPLDRFRNTMLIASFFILIVAALAGILFYVEAQQRFNDSRLLKRQRAELEILDTAAAHPVTTAEEEDGQGAFDPVWTATQSRLTLYHDLAVIQSRRSFKYAQAAMWVGMTLIGASLIAALFAGSPSRVAGVTAIGALAAALGGYLAKTFIKSQELATRQLHTYFNQPVELARALAAERVIAMIQDGGVKSQALSVLADSIMHHETIDKIFNDVPQVTKD